MIIMTDDQIAAHLANRLLQVRFRSKRRMADGLNVPYRILLMVCSGNGNKDNVICVTNSILRYCISHQIHLDKFDIQLR